MNHTQRIFLVAAGSGGHILPALVLGRHWREKNPSGEIYFFSSKKHLDQKIIHQSSMINHVVTLPLTASLSLKKWWRLPFFSLQFFLSFLISWWYLLTKRPEKIVSTGGMISIPLCIAAKIMRVPIELYELNAVPGQAVKALLPFATKICVPFAQAALHCSLLGKSFVHKCSVVPYPLRFTSHDNQENDAIFATINEQIGKKLFAPSHQTILVIGGSQGSAFLNKSIQTALEIIKNNTEMIQVIHQTGSEQQETLAQFYKKNNVPAYVFDFDSQLAWYYQIADVVICRAGAGTLFEVAHFKKMCITIPLIAHSTSHQKDNALAMVASHPELFTVLEQQQVLQDPHLLVQALNKHLTGQS